VTAVDVLRPRKPGLGAGLTEFALAHTALAFAVLRRLKPILVLGKTVLVTRHDDVREVFLADADFPVPYAAKLSVIMGGEPFFLGMDDGEAYRRDTAAMRMAVRPADLPNLAAQAAARAQALAQARGGEVEVVDFTRQITFDVLCAYFGIASGPPGYDLRVLATRLFEFQFADFGNDPALLAEVQPMAKALREHVDGLIAARKANAGPDDVLSRCLAYQAQGLPGFSDTQIRSALIGFVVGGLPQPPMVAPQALEQLLRRPRAMAAAQAAAKSGDIATLGGCVFEALRFDPLAPALTRMARRDRVIAAGAARQTTIKAGSTVMVAFSSAMRDPRRLADPERFDPDRPWSAYMHFGQGLHTCFGLHINRATIPVMLQALLVRPNLRRAPGKRGRLLKRGPFADTLWVRFDN
jgi:cytochrome P450